jgi:hypothetical protein
MSITMLQNEESDDFLKDFGKSPVLVLVCRSALAQYGIRRASRVWSLGYGKTFGRCWELG